MPANMTTLAPVNLRADALAQANLQHSAPSQNPGLTVKSTDLLQGQKVVAITHNGLTYRLQATRLGKLILTK